MFPNSSNLGRPPFHSKHQRQTDCFNTLPVNTSPTLFSDQQTLVPPFNFRTAVLSRALSNGNLAASPAVTLQPMNVSPVSTSGALTSFQGRKRPREESISRNVKHQRIDSQNSDTTVLNQAVPSPEERRQSLPRPISVQSPQFLPSGSPALTSCVPPLRDTLFPDPTEIRPPVAKDQLSQQILELFQACRQQASDLNRKELCRTELQREIQLIFPQSRLYLVGSSLNGFGTRSSDGDLCLIVKEQPVNQKTEARCILSSVHRLFSTKLFYGTIQILLTVSSFWDKKEDINRKLLPFSFLFAPSDLFLAFFHHMKRFGIMLWDIFAAVAQGDLVYHNPSENIVAEFTSYIERPQLIRAKVPIVKFRDKVSCVDFDLNVNNVVGIRNTFLLRTYAFIENRVRPLVVAVKKWASCHEINDASRGTLNSYSLVLMVLHYLQTLPEPILPSLQKNYPECFDPTMQLHLVHQAPYTIPPYISKNGSSLGDLLTGFFRYYATEFDWSHQMISVREAKAIPRPDGTEWRNKFICVEEPFDGTNTARAVHEKQKFDIIRGEFSQAWRLLRDKKDLNCILPLRANKQKR